MNSGDTAWVLAAAALVMLMTPGLAFFYGGMVGAKSVLNMLMMNFVMLGVVSTLWVLYGYSEAFGDDAFHGLIGDTSHVLLRDTHGTMAGPAGHQIPTMAFAMFQLMFAVITTALISGSIAERTRFWPWLLFAVGWCSVVYFPVAHWVFHATGFTGTDADGVSAEVGGWIVNNLKAFDFAGGTAVHINAGAAGLAMALVLRQRLGWPKSIPRPHNVPFTLLGAALLWFGWYGFNAGSALAANDLAALAFTNTTVATGAALLAWIVVEQLRDGKPTTLGAASGAVAGLVAITPACGFVDTIGALAIGIAAGIVCALAVGMKFFFGLDDSLDVVGVHLFGGLVGTLLVGVFADAAVNPAGGDGLLYGGGWTQVQRQAIAAGAVLVYSFAATYLLAKLIDLIIGFRVGETAELEGIDETEHAETAYDLSPVAQALGMSQTHRSPPRRVDQPW
ncbi:ammonium transporter [Nocardia jejuensis]|uniref:ammonium transporter n=1 Tax=Nocardia jejuensis TaxID=328049 RepID=UPI000B005488|nr:ammonium transporter [Nocardia jejuensis]